MSEKVLQRLYLRSERDELFEKGPWPKPFAFNEAVARVFDDMVSRSVPLYHEVVACAAHWARRYYQDGTKVFDVGCSTGTFMELLGRFFPQPVRMVGVDNSESMLDQARDKLEEVAAYHNIELLCQSATQVDYSESSVVVMNYTLQFLPISERKQVIQAIYDGLVPGGLLFVSEKVKSSTPQFQETVTQYYEAFKEANGYAKTEIERKKEALEHVLVPLTYEQQEAMLLECGFASVDTLIKMHNFTTFVALKADSSEKSEAS